MQAAFVVRVDVERDAHPVCGGDADACALVRCGQLPGSLARAPSQSLALRIGPTVEPWCLRDMESLEKLSAVERQRSLGVAGIECGIELGYVAPELCDADTHFVGTGCDHAVGQLTTQEVQRVPKGGSGVLLVELRPEMCEERVPPLEAARLRGGEIGEKREPLRLRHHTQGPGPGGRPQIDRAKEAELDHVGPLRALGGRQNCAS